MTILNHVHYLWHIIIFILGLLLPVFVSMHVILYKRDSRAALTWVGFIWLVPIIGSILYLLFGVNRIRNKALTLRGNMERYKAQSAHPEPLQHALQHYLPQHEASLTMLARIVEGVVKRPLLPGNKIELLINGDEAYPAMLDTIKNARSTISFMTYIFDRDAVGIEFAQALGEAVRRGVEVRALIDATGSRYSFPTIFHTLKREGVPSARFLPPFTIMHPLSLNMRTHRKIMVVDGHTGFTGGMNIRVAHCLNRHKKNPVQDIHFRIQGPVVAQLQEVFSDDWLFTTGESLRGETWFPPLSQAGEVLARGVTDGPDENFEKLRWTLLGALSIARHSIRIMTPYFLPDDGIITALNLAAMRGVKVDIILPEQNNLPYVQWASRAMWWQILKYGCRIWLTPPPFDHSKLMLVDGCWVLLGSANWDARSLRLNFEFNVECYDDDLALQLNLWMESKRKRARLVTLAEVDNRPLPARLRDGIARLLTPYL